MLHKYLCNPFSDTACKVLFFLHLADGETEVQNYEVTYPRAIQQQVSEPGFGPTLRLQTFCLITQRFSLMVFIRVFLIDPSSHLPYTD